MRGGGEGGRGREGKRSELDKDDVRGRVAVDVVVVDLLGLGGRDDVAAHCGHQHPVAEVHHLSSM